MKQFISIGLIVLALISTGLGQPRSGYVRTVSYRIDSENTRGETTAETRIWFTPTCTRKQRQAEDAILWIHVRGDHWWSAYPRIKRFQRHDPPPWGFRSYLHEVKWFAERFEELEPTEQATVAGYPCDVYQWHVEEQKEKGCIRMPAYDITCWANANDDFPVRMRYETSRGNGTETAEMKLDCHIPASLFEEPMTLPYQAIEHSKRAICDRNHGDPILNAIWMARRNQTPVCERGRGIVHLIEVANTNAKGKTTDYKSRKELSDNEVTTWLHGLVGQPYWSGLVCLPCRRHRHRRPSRFPGTPRSHNGH